MRTIWGLGCVSKTGTSDDARDKRLGVICEVLGRRVCGWTTDFVEEGGMSIAIAEVIPRCMCVSRAESVVTRCVVPCSETVALNSMVKIRAVAGCVTMWHLASRLAARVELSPAISSNHATGWACGGSGWSGAQKEQLHDTVMPLAVVELGFAVEACCDMPA